MRNSNGIILVYDITNINSFEKVDYWLKSVRQVSREDSTVYLLGNKIDLTKDYPKCRKVNQEIVSKFITENGVDYWVECSAKDNLNLDGTFHKFYMGKFSIST